MNDRLLGFISIGMKAGAYTLGSDMTERAARAGKTHLIILSEDASANTKKLVYNVAKTKNIEVIEHYEMDVLGAACGKPQLSVIGVKKRDIARQLISLYAKTVKGGKLDDRTEIPCP
ncbi:MAG: ribosomal L7Ae/L30e/S12e/Gadd45 family protein [Clostridia bacterium]|jgi:ribosomal protein L7Ae-like RNA K-turn-binding protein|nr:ribosomal L7Ae/L30e/S12e/Gadd45 family protein [Clostridia bacterium]MBQ1435401.1 ribosomal L7Ae/L30e/S12e/Gadd45 family protein [Clostridia bacterium]MBQ4248407.1 ribosomal L7Ae/L30e/S12e/Gadd45 family protein [Clostridia bacterium]